MSGGTERPCLSCRPAGAARRTALGGYLLVETIVAMAVLSLSMVGIHRGIRQSIMVRGQSQDFTTARFLLERVAAEQELQPLLVEGSGSDRFPDPFTRFSYEWTITKLPISRPSLPGNLTPADRQRIENTFKDHIGKLEVKISWTRGGSVFEAVGETLLKPGQLWQPPKNALPNRPT